MGTGIKSLMRAFEILEYIASNQGGGVSEISSKLTMNKSTVFSILKTFSNLGYIYKNEMTGKYHLTYRLHSIALQSSQSNSFVGYARPYLQKLLNIYDETVHFVSSSENTVIYIDKLESKKTIRIYTTIGAEMPLHCTAVGKAILARRDDQEILEYAERTGLPSLTENSIADKERLLEEMHLVRQRGYSIDDEENQQDLYCIGMPILVPNERTRYAISLSMPKYRKDDIKLSQAVEALASTAHELSLFF